MTSAGPSEWMSGNSTPNELAAEAGAGAGSGPASGASVMLATMSAASAWKLARTSSPGSRFWSSCCSVSGGVAARAPCAT